VLVILALEGSALAWQTEVVFDGTPEGTVATVAAVKSWSGTDEVFILYEVMDPSTQPFTTQLQLVGYQCTPSDCSAVAQAYGPDPVGRPLRGQPSMPSMAIRRGPELRILHRGRTFADCDGDGVLYDLETTGPDLEELDLLEEIWTPASGWTEEIPVVSSTAAPCGNRGLSSLRHHPSTGDPHACWAHQPPSGSDELECGSRPLAPPYAWSWTTFDNGGSKQDHPWLAFDPAGQRVVAHRHTNESIAVRFVDAADLSASYDAGLEEDYPVLDLARATGTFHLAWHEASGEDSLLAYARCELASAAAGCQDWADWAPSLEAVQETGEHLKHVGLAVDRQRVFLVYMEDIDDDDTTEQYRVRWRTRCGTDPWTAPETLRTPATDTWDQSITYGRPVLAVNREDNVLHVVFTEADSHNFDYSDSDVIWARTTYEDCAP
jgi:hypothetical protein